MPPFVVGAGRNGIEYSVLLVVVFVLLAWTGGGARAGAERRGEERDP